MVKPHAITQFIEAIDNIFRVFTALDMSTIRTLPALYLIRIIYTVLILVKLHFAAVKLPPQDAADLQLDRLQVSQRLNRVIQMTAGWGPLWPATKLTAVFVRMREWLESEEQKGASLTRWEIVPQSLSRDVHGFNTVEVASDDRSPVGCSPRGLASWVPSSLASTGVDTDTLGFSLEPTLGTGFQSMSQATESCFPGEKGRDVMRMQDEGVGVSAGVLPAVNQRLGDIPDIDQMEMGMDWSQLSNTGFDMSDFEAPFFGISPGLDPDAAMREDTSNTNP